MPDEVISGRVGVRLLGKGYLMDDAMDYWDGEAE
jgi:hypothetical protein